MWLYYVSMGLAILSGMVYHLAQKATPPSVNPVLSLVLTYLVAIAVCLLLIPFFPLKEGLWVSLRQLNWASYVLALAIVGLEIGFLLAYRAGWNISLAAVFSNVAATLLLIPAGLLLFKEKVSVVNLLGVVLCVAGLVLVNQK